MESISAVAAEARGRGGKRCCIVQSASAVLAVLLWIILLVLFRTPQSLSLQLILPYDASVPPHMAQVAAPLRAHVASGPAEAPAAADNSAATLTTTIGMGHTSVS